MYRLNSWEDVGSTTQFITHAMWLSVGRGDISIQSCGMENVHVRLYLSVPMYSMALLSCVVLWILIKKVITELGVGVGVIVCVSSVCVSCAGFCNVGNESHMIPGGCSPTVVVGVGICSCVALFSLWWIAAGNCFWLVSHVISPLILPGG